MVRCKNVGGNPSDDERRSCRFTDQEKVKGSKEQIAKKKHKRADREVEMAEAMADAAERAERGGRDGALTIAERLTPAQRGAVEESEAWSGTPPSTTVVGVTVFLWIAHQRTPLWRRQRSSLRQSSRQSSLRQSSSRHHSFVAPHVLALRWLLGLRVRDMVDVFREQLQQHSPLLHQFTMT